jgi:hypothetical protein
MLQQARAALREVNLQRESEVSIDNMYMRVCVYYSVLWR